MIEYIYTDEKGAPKHGVHRGKPKHFSQFQVASDGVRNSGLNGMETFLYNLPAVQKAIQKGATILLVEGEKDAETLIQLGYVATTKPGGAGGWKERFSEMLLGAKVVMIPDNDPAGLRYVDEVGESLNQYAESFRVCYLPNLGKGEDVSDWLNSGNSPEDLATCISEWCKPWYPDNDPLQANSWTIGDLMSQEFPHVHWAIDGVIAEGVTLLAGPPKVGKTFWALEASISLALGRKVFGTVDAGQANVLYLCCEGTKTNIRQRCLQIADGSTMKAEVRLEFEWPSGQAGIDALEQYLTRRPDIELVIVDTLKAIRGTTSSRKNAYDVDYDEVKPFTKVAELHGVNIILLHHTNKGDWDDPFDSISGSTGIRGGVDNEAVMLKNPDGSITLTARGRGQEEVELVFTKDPSNLRFALTGDAAEVMGNEQRQIIFDVLKEHGIPVKPKDLFKMIASRGYTRTESAMRHMLTKMTGDPDVAVLGDGHRGYYVDAVNSERSTGGASQGSQSSQDRPPQPGKASPL